MGGIIKRVEEPKVERPVCSRGVRAAVGLPMAAVGCLMAAVVCAWKVKQTAPEATSWEVVMVLASILAGVSAFGVLSIGAAGARTGRIKDCVDKKRSKAGALFVVSGLLCLVPVSWSAGHPETRCVGWSAGALLLAGGSVLLWRNCCRCDPHRHDDNAVMVEMQGGGSDVTSSSVSSASAASLEYIGGGGSDSSVRGGSSAEEGSSPLVTVAVSLWWYEVWWKTRKPA